MNSGRRQRLGERTTQTGFIEGGQHVAAAFFVASEAAALVLLEKPSENPCRRVCITGLHNVGVGEGKRVDDVAAVRQGFEHGSTDAVVVCESKEHGAGLEDGIGGWQPPWIFDVGG